MVAPEGGMHHAKESRPLPGRAPLLNLFSFARAPIIQRSDVARVTPPESTLT